ncbi:PREDICTED: uncharacterized protein LOC108377740 [Rhagoletis zephyria]|nr:PREDICTED: uncharacterized protein LOC108377740 [Rhagoletis zephyria]
MKAHKGRNAAPIKGYIAVFVCLATRAMHLEVVSDLTTDAFIAALKRFVSRRGLPSDMHSDNGTNFIGANRELMKSFKQMSKSRDVGSYMATSFINWHLIPPGAPHFGGIWESAVKATKFHLRRVLGETRLTYEEFATLLCEI